MAEAVKKGLQGREKSCSVLTAPAQAPGLSHPTQHQIPGDTHGQKECMPHQDIRIIAGQIPQVLGQVLLKIFQLLRVGVEWAVGLVSPTSAALPCPSTSCPKSQTGQKPAKSELLFTEHLVCARLVLSAFRDNPC